jgi:hypothetical protein
VDYDYPPGIPLDVCQLFEELTFKVRAVGFDRYSSDAVLHRIRWEYQIERGRRDFKCNNNWTADLSRWFMKKYPAAKGFFEIRVLRRGRHHDQETTP